MNRIYGTGGMENVPSTERPCCKVSARVALDQSVSHSTQLNEPELSGRELTCTRR
jgi:hypothetical protein